MPAPIPLLAFAALFCAVSLRAVDSGQPAPDFSFKDLDGKPHQLSEYRGKVVILEWMNPTCPIVGRHYRSGSMQATQAAAAAEGAVWLQINSSSMADLDSAKSAEWQKKQGVTATAYIRDQPGKIGRLYAAETTPQVYVIAKDGTLVYQGAIDDQPNASQVNTPNAHNYVKAALAALKAGQPIDPSKTQPYGCGVKYGAEG
jgi:peroxiredoxin